MHYISKDMKELEPAYTAGRNTKEMIILNDDLVFLKVIHSPTL